jgi:hypothetical protein
MLWHMRTTLHLNPALIKRAKTLALKQGITLTSLLEESLRRLLNPSSQESPKKISDLCTVKGCTQPGVDLNDSAALLDLMEKSHDTH